MRLFLTENFRNIRHNSGLEVLWINVSLSVSITTYMESGRNSNYKDSDDCLTGLNSYQMNYFKLFIACPFEGHHIQLID
jgi:hypothetical protein